MESRTLRWLLLLLLTACTPGGHFAIHEENDIFNDLAKNQDKFYTQGAKLTYTFPPNQEKETPTVDSLAAGNNIFTPFHKHVSAPLKDERPYAGYSYGEFKRRYYPSSNIENSYGLQAGLIGPDSGGKFFQCGVHKLLKEACPAGWANQLKDEPTLLLQIEQRRKTEIQTLGALNFDFIGNYGGELGNVSTLGRIGGLVRVGIFDGGDFGPTLIFPRIDRFAVDIPKPTQWYLFAGTEGRYVVRNIFLDGNTWEKSLSVDKEPLVADLKFGASLIYKEIKLTYQLVWVTNEYKESESAQAFGAIDVSFGW